MKPFKKIIAAVSAAAMLTSAVMVSPAGSLTGRAADLLTGTGLSALEAPKINALLGGSAVNGVQTIKLPKGSKLPVKCKGLFANYLNLRSLTFADGVNSTAVTDMSSLFAGDKNLKSVNFGTTAETANLQTFDHMFTGCVSIETVDLSALSGTYFGTVMVKTTSGTSDDPYGCVDGLFDQAANLKSFTLSGRFLHNAVTNIAALSAQNGGTEITIEGLVDRMLSGVPESNSNKTAIRTSLIKAYNDYESSIRPADTVTDWEPINWAWTQEADGSWVCDVTISRLNNTHEEMQTVEATVTAAEQKPACEEAGTISYSASWTREDGKVFDAAEKKVVEVPASGHAYAFNYYIWDPGNRTGFANVTCAHCGDTKNVELEVTTSTSSTCGKDTTIYQMCYEGQEPDTLTITNESTTHVGTMEYQYIRWEETDNPYPVVVKKCSECGALMDYTAADLPEGETLTVSEEQVAPTCDEPGNHILHALYSSHAGAEDEVREESSYVAEITDPLGHQMHCVEITFSRAADGTVTALAQLECVRQGGTCTYHTSREDKQPYYVVIQAAEEPARYKAVSGMSSGQRVYTASYTDDLGETKTAEVTYEIAPQILASLGHASYLHESINMVHIAGFKAGVTDPVMIYWMDEDEKFEVAGELRDDGRYDFPIPLAPAEMTERCYYTFKGTYEGMEISLESTKLYSYCFRDYLDSLMKNGSSPQSKRLGAALAEYGAYAQNLFGVNLGAMANVNRAQYYGELDLNDALSEISDVDPFGAVTEKIAEENVLFVPNSASMQLTSSPRMMIQFKAAEGAEIGDLSSYYLRATGKATRFNVGYTPLEMNDAGTLYYGIESRIRVPDLADDYEFCVVRKEANGSYTQVSQSFSYSPARYVRFVIDNAEENQTNTALKDTLKALLLYGKAAREYGMVAGWYKG